MSAAVDAQMKTAPFGDSWVFAAVSVCLLTGCGGGSGNTPAPIQIQFSPSAPSIPVNSSIRITATTTPPLPTNYTGSGEWSIAGDSSACIQALPSSACPSGTLAWNILPDGYVQLTVTYYASSTPGTYQVSLQAEILDSTNQNKIDYQGTATLPVIVTAQ